jgi:hypothetical protein
MKIPLKAVLGSISAWRAQIAEAIEAEDAKIVLRHLDASMQQAEMILRQASSRSEEID